MKYYFRFYNLANQEKYYIYDSTKNEIYNTNLNMFDLKFFTSDINIEYNKITNYKLILEREVNGVYIQDSYVEGYQFDGYIKFDKCILNKELINDSNIKYNCYLEFYEGGILVYTSVKNPITILFKSVCDDFNISIKNSIYLGDSYELQDDEVEKINFEIVVESEGNNTLQYYYSFNSEEKIEHKEFSILGTNKKEFEYIVATNIFKNDSTNLHFFLKDSFGNIRYKIYKINTKNKVIEVFDIIDYNNNILGNNTELSFFYNQKNVTTIKPKIKIEYGDSNEEISSEKEISISNNSKNMISFVLSDHFETISEKLDKSNKIYISFILNGGNNTSSELELIYDNSFPNIIFNNIENDYLLIKEENTEIVLNGQIQDNNIFYLGKNKKKYDFENINFHSIIYSEQEIYFIKENEEYKKIQNKLDNYYLIDSETHNFTLHDYDYNKITNYKIINDYSEDNQKVFFIYFDKDKLSTYERNIIEHNELIIRENLTNHIIKYETFEIGSKILFKVFVKKELSEYLNIDLIIDGFEYNFIKYIEKSSVSCDIDFKKKIDLSFKQSKLLFVNFNDEYKIIVSNDKKIVSNKNPIFIDNLSIIPLSLRTNEFFTADKEINFTDNNLNLKDVANIYFYPTLKINGIPENIIYFDLNFIQDGIYNFELNIPVKNDYNTYTFTFSDIFENTNNKELYIEKQINPVEITFDEKYSNDIIFKKGEEYIDLYVNKKSLTFKLIINNETKLDSDNNDYIILNENKNIKYKIIREEGIHYSIINLYNLEDGIYNVFYSNSNIPLLTFNVHLVNELFINFNEKNISGTDRFYLYLETNEFAKISYATDNTNFKITDISTSDKNRILQVQRLSANHFIEVINIHLTIYDEKNIFISKHKNVEIVFYNDNVIHEYWIDENYLDDNGNLLKPSFDLNIKTFQSEYIKSIYYYDDLELDFYKRKKSAIKKDDNLYVIEDIISPINPSYINILIDIDYDVLIQITKKLFENNLIQLSKNVYDLTVDYFQYNDKIIAKIKNNLSISEEFNIEILANDSSIYSKNNVLLEKNKEMPIIIDNKNIQGKTLFKTKLIDKNNILLTLNDCEILIENNYKDYINDILNLQKYNIKNLNESLIINFKELNSYNNYLKITTPLMNIEEYLIEGNSKSINLDQIGLYEIQHIVEYIGRKTIVNIYYIYVVENYYDDIFIRNSSFKKYNFVKNIILNNSVKYDLEILNPKIEYWLNGEKIKEYIPYQFNNNEIQFIVDKFNGESEYIYIDNFISKVIYSNKIEHINNIHPELYSFNTKNEKAFYIKNNIITLENKSNLYFKSKGINEIIIMPENSIKTFTKIIIEDSEDVILSGFMPCKIECIDSESKMIKDYYIKIKEDNIE